MKSDNLELGKIITTDQHRDAIHIAVAPVVAYGKLAPGQDIGFLEAGNTEKVTAVCEKPIGIVDPFLKRCVLDGERFWMFLYPYTITSLRHDWTHPDFAEIVPVVAASISKEASEAWLRNFCETADCPDYETIMEILTDGETGSGYHRCYLDGEYIHIGGSDAHGEIPPEFWVHAEIVTGKKFSERATYFSCSC